MDNTVCLLILIFLLMAFISNMESFTELLTNSNSNNSHTKIKVYWFKTKTCPHCIKMCNSWASLYKLYNSDLRRKKLFDLIEIDVNDNSYSDIVNKYDDRIKENHSGGGVPNIVMIMPSGKDYVYSGDRSASHMDYWIRLTSGKKNI